MIAYDSFRDQVAWARSLGDERIPGVPNRAAPVTITARRDEKLEAIKDDVVSNVQFATFPEHAVRPRDTLDGAEVLHVSAVKDAAGNVLWWVAYGRA